MKKILSHSVKTIYTWVLFWITVLLVVYAENITQVTTQTINTWDTIWSWWYQDVNDFVDWWGGSSGLIRYTWLWCAQCPHWSAWWNYYHTRYKRCYVKNHNWTNVIDYILSRACYGPNQWEDVGNLSWVMWSY